MSLDCLSCPVSSSDETAGILQRAASTADVPIYSYLELTHQCNLRCPHCYLTDRQNRDELSLSEIRGVLDELAAMGSLVLYLTGGEVTRRADFLQILKEAVARRFVVILKSNGVIQSLTASALRDEGLYELQVSLYAMDARRHDEFVGMQGAWEAAVSAMRAFSAADGRVRASVVLMKWNLDQALLLEEFCEREGFEFTVDFRLEPRRDGDVSPTALRVGIDEMIALGSQLASCQKVAAMGPLNGGVSSALCGIGRSVVVIHPNGDVTPCIATPWIVLGNVRDTALADIWRKNSLRDDLQRIRWQDSSTCVDCELMPDCHRCLSTAFQEHGDIRQPSTTDCEMALIRSGIRKRLMAGEP